MDPGSKRVLRQSCKLMRCAVDAHVQRLEATSEQATASELQAAASRWPRVTHLVVRVRDPNPLTKAAVREWFPCLRPHSPEFQVSGCGW